MTAAPRPATEALRLAKLYSYNILDTLPETAYDELARLAAYICQTPTALVSFIDVDRQWFKARVGIDSNETQRSVAFCNHTIRQTDVMVIPDARVHPAFKDNPLVTQAPFIRFYAGAPLISPDGYALGSLCVVDSVPHEITPNQIEALRVLSHQVVALLELSYQSRELINANQTLEDKVQERTAKLTRSLHRLVNAQSTLLKRETFTRQQALNDPSTGLPDQSYFLPRLRQSVQLSLRQPKHQYAVIMIELVEMQSICDTHGQSAGEMVLSQVAARVQQLLRKSDLIARTGRNELSILFDDIPELGQVMAAVERLQHCLIQSVELAGHPLSSGACLGIAFSEVGYHQAESVIRDAKVALHQARRLSNRRQRAQLQLRIAQQDKSSQPPVIVQDDSDLPLPQYVVFTPGTTTLQLDSFSIEDELREALLHHQFELHFQPIFFLSNAQLTGFEALIRWNHPSRGLLAAREFFSTAERIGLMPQLSEFVFQTSCDVLSQWRQFFSPSLTLHINLSLLQLQNPQLINQLKSALSRHSLVPSDLELEVKEAVLLSRDPAVMAALETLKAMGFRLCIDDFGREQSSLSRLHRLQIDTLKIDQSFVHALDHSTGINVARTIIDFGRSAQKAVIAKHIESAEQLGTLLALGCKQGQGYWLSKPLDTNSLKRVF